MEESGIKLFFDSPSGECYFCMGSDWLMHVTEYGDVCERCFKTRTGNVWNDKAGWWEAGKRTRLEVFLGWVQLMKSHLRRFLRRIF